MLISIIDRHINVLRVQIENRYFPLYGVSISIKVKNFRSNRSRIFLSLRLKIFIGHIISSYVMISKFESYKRHLRVVLLFAINSKKFSAEARQIIVETYSEAFISERTCREWFQRYKSGDSKRKR